jgi:Transposase and inactivated derivatives
MSGSRRKQDIGDELRLEASRCGRLASLRLLAVADHFEGACPARIGLDHEIPAATVSRWIAVHSREGVGGLISLPHPQAEFAAIDPEVPALAAHEASPGVERTALKAVAAACRGAALEEIAAHYAAEAVEVREWMDEYLAHGAGGIALNLRPTRWWFEDHEQAFAGIRRLPYGVSAGFLRELHLRSEGDFADRVLGLALVYEGRSVDQVARLFKVSRSAVDGWVLAFIRNGLAGLAPRRPYVRVPRRTGFGAGAVAALADDIGNPEMLKRLKVVEMAYRHVPVHQIAVRCGIAFNTVETIIRRFEKDGLDGLSTGDATLTPPLRSDYTAERLRDLAESFLHDEPGRRRMEAVALLYEGQTMADVGRRFDGLTALSYLVGRFNRFGHEILASFNHAQMTPPRPAPRREILPKDPASAAPIEMRTDLNSMRMERIRGAYTSDAEARIDVVVDAYDGFSRREISERRSLHLGVVTRWLANFNEQGLDWLEDFRKRKPHKSRKSIPAPAVPVRRIELPGDWNAALVGDAIARTVDEEHRKELAVIQRLYISGGDIRRIPAELGIAEAEIERLAASFDLYGETLGHGSRLRRMLPAQYDRAALTQACREHEPLRTYAQIVAALYAGRSLGNVKATYDLSDEELEKIVAVFREKGVDGLREDPLEASGTIAPVRTALPLPRVPVTVPKPAPAPAPVPRAVEAAASEPVKRAAPQVMRPSKPVHREYKAPVKAVEAPLTRQAGRQGLSAAAAQMFRARTRDASRPSGSSTGAATSGVCLRSSECRLPRSRSGSSPMSQPECPSSTASRTSEGIPPVDGIFQLENGSADRTLSGQRPNPIKSCAQGHYPFES